ncbi:hypothetical protein HWV62_21996 [Athelia sp. TMB]|nr:hypothetical protein HWV62_21996 [Athelia sp. TMB]
MAIKKVRLKKAKTPKKVTREFISDWGDDGSGNFTVEPKDDTTDAGDGPGDDPGDGSGDGDLDGDNVVVNHEEPATQEAADAASKRFNKLRDKLAQLYRRRYKSVTNAPSAQQGSFSGLFGNDAWAAPRKRSAIQTYTKLYYISRMKADYERRFAVSCREWDAATEQQRCKRMLKRPQAVSFRGGIVREYWEAETEEFRLSMEREAVRDQKEALEEWKEMKSAPKTPQQFHHQLNFIAQYIRPIADAIASQMQAAVSIHIVGPIPERNGEIEARSINVNWPGSLSGSTWPQYDPSGFSAAQKSLISYARSNFSIEECKRRALPESEVEEMTLLQEIEEQDVAISTAPTITNLSLPPSIIPSTAPPPASLQATVPAQSSTLVPTPPVASTVTARPAGTPVPLIGATSTVASTIIGTPAVTPVPLPIPNSTEPHLPLEEPIVIHAGAVPSQVPVSKGRRPIAPPAREQRDESPLLDDTRPSQSRSPSPSSGVEDSMTSGHGDASFTDHLEFGRRCDTGTTRDFDGMALPFSPSASPTQTIVDPPLPLVHVIPMQSSTPSTPIIPVAVLHPPGQPVAVALPPPRPRPRPVTAGIVTRRLGYSKFSHALLFGSQAPDSAAADVRDTSSALPTPPSTQRSVIPELPPAPAAMSTLQDGTGGNIPPLTDLRPLEVREWMRVSKGWIDRDIVTEDFGAIWWKWWSALQPSSRFEEGRLDMMSPTYLMEWKTIRKPGKNGLLLIIMSLRWWGVASTASGEWQKAVDDVSAAIFCMVNEMEHAKEPTTSKTKRAVRVPKAGTSGQKLAGKETRVAKTKKGWVGWVEVEDDDEDDNISPAPPSEAGRAGLRSSGAADSSSPQGQLHEPNVPAVLSNSCTGH